jgi:hypothetical protein
MSMGDMSTAGMGGGDADGVSAATDGGFEKFRKMREEAAARAAAEGQPVASKSADGASGKKGAHASSSSNGKKSGARGGGDDDDWGDEGSGTVTRGGKGGGGSKARGGGDDWNDDGWVRRAREGAWTRRDEQLCTVVLLAPRVAADCLSVYREMTMMAGVPGPPPRWLSTHTNTQTHPHTVRLRHPLPWIQSA